MLDKLLLGQKTLVMGILNVTPDSFSDGGLYFDLDKAVNRAEEMIKGRADIIDVGGESTRPGSSPIYLEEELRRTIPVIGEIRKRFGASIIISIDTFKAKVASEALRAGASMVNSLGGFKFDEKLAEVIVKYKCPIILYHIKGRPRTMQKGKIIYKDVVLEIKKFFEEQIKFGLSKGIKVKQFLIDPGIGFGKNLDQNLEIIKRLSEFQALNLPITIGVSRKSHLGQLLQEELKFLKPVSSNERLEASLAETAIAVLNGAKIIRTHDVFQAKKFLAVLDKLKK